MSTTPQAVPSCPPDPLIPLTPFNPDLPGAPIYRDAEDRGAKDRLPVIRYGRPARSNGRVFTRGEDWLINDPRLPDKDRRSSGRGPDHARARDRYLLGTILDDDASEHPLETRPSLVRLMLAQAWGAGILVESSLSDPVLAVVAEMSRQRSQYGPDGNPAARLLVTGIPETAPTRTRRTYERGIEIATSRVDPHVLGAQVKGLMASATAMYVDWFESDGTPLSAEVALVRLVGAQGQPRRSLDQAACAEQHLSLQGWSDVDIQRYLRLHGFLNEASNIGVWNPINLNRLRMGG